MGFIPEALPSYNVGRFELLRRHERAVNAIRVVAGAITVVNMLGGPSRLFHKRAAARRIRRPFSPSIYDPWNRYRGALTNWFTACGLFRFLR